MNTDFVQKEQMQELYGITRVMLLIAGVMTFGNSLLIVEAFGGDLGMFFMDKVHFSALGLLLLALLVIFREALFIKGLNFALTMMFFNMVLVVFFLLLVLIDFPKSVLADFFTYTENELLALKIGLGLTAFVAFWVMTSKTWKILWFLAGAVTLSVFFFFMLKPYPIMLLSLSCSAYYLYKAYPFYRQLNASAAVLGEGFLSQEEHAAHLK